MMRQLLGKGTPPGLQDLSVESLLMLLRLWIAILVGHRLGNRGGSNANALASGAVKFSLPWRQNEQPTFTTGC